MEIQVIKNEEELAEFGKNFLDEISENGKESALVCALTGDLGSGKTTFVQKLAKELGILEVVTSPTFVIQKSYQTQNSHITTLVHLDAYRLESASELEKLDFKETIKLPNSLVCIEWAEKIKSLLPEHTYWLKFSITEEDFREIVVEPPK